MHYARAVTTILALLPGAGSRFMSGQSTSDRLIGLGIVLLILGVPAHALQPSLHQRANSSPEIGQQLPLEPRVLLHPQPAPPARVRERNDARQVGLEVPHGLGERVTACFEIVVLRVLADEQRELDAGKRSEQWRMPLRRALSSRWQISALAPAGPAESHRQNGEELGIIEGGAIDAEPLAQMISRVVVPGRSRGVHLCARRLADEQHLRVAMHAEHRPRTMGKVRGAVRARVGLLNE